MQMSNLDKYIIARWCYGIGEDFVDDIEYRDIESKVKEENPECEYLQRSWSDDPCPIDLLKKYNLMHLYRDIKFQHKSESIRSINTDSEFNSIFSSLNEPSRLSFKHDGWNIQINYFNGVVISAETRGRTGNSLNANVVMEIVPKKIPILGKVKVTGELTILNSKWPIVKLIYDTTSQRNSVSTCLANNRIDLLAFSAFNIQSDSIALIENHYDLLAKLGFNTPYYVTVSNFAQLQRGMKLLEKINTKYDYPNDGLVIENSQYQLAIRVGAWKEEVMQSYVVGYEENYGAYGNSMIVNIKPIVYNGAERRQVSVTNLQFILDSDLQIGSPIAFDNRSMVTAVLNQTRTKELHDEWNGRYDEYRSLIDERSLAK